MTLLEDAQQTMLDLADLTEGIGRGAIPDLHGLIGLQSRLVRCRFLVGKEFTARFKGKERANLARKVAQAKEHLKGRRSLNMTSKDAEERAIEEVEALHDEEIERMTEFELYREFLRSLQTAFDHSRSVLSYLKGAESHADQ